MDAFDDFVKAMRKAKPGKRICYFRGGNVSDGGPSVERIACFCRALYELDLAKLYQVREEGVMAYYIVLRERLRMRKDGQGSLQEAKLLMGVC